jgi:hypothetical protein
MGAPCRVITVTTWLWQQPSYRKAYSAKHVNTLRNMVERHLSLPHRFVCFTDMPQGIDSRVDVRPLPKTPAVTWNPGRPNCFRRLWLFSQQAAEMFPGRIVSLDLDAVVVGPLDALYDRKEEFVAWKDAIIRGQYNGSMWLLTAGSRTKVWSEFKGDESVARMRGRMGSDQGWISAMLPNEATWTEKNGVLSYRKHVQKRGLPDGAKIVFFHGRPNPWEAPDAWIKEHYR